MGQPFTRIDVHEFKRRRDEGWAPFVLDVRGQNESDLVSLDFTDRLQPHTAISAIVDALPRDRDILVYCRSGGRSGMAAGALAAHGFDRLFNLEGGINAWATQIDTRLAPY